MEKFKSDLSGKEFASNQKVTGRGIRPAILNQIRQQHPHFNEDCTLSLLEKQVLDALHHNQTISDDVDQSVEETLTYGQRLADRIAEFGGSWTFIISFFAVLFTWIAANVYLFTKPFDPYPFILLNLILSCLAALQAPVIMMSQNRQEEKDRERSRHDYQVNLKAELEIRMLHEKMDHLILNQQQRLFEIQQIQVEMLKDITDRLYRHAKD
jgi:uncharacterized membrane protein